MSFVPEYFLRRGNYILEKDQKIIMNRKFGKLYEKCKYSTSDSFTFGGQKYTIKHVLWKNISVKSFDMYVTVIFKSQKENEPTLALTISTDSSQHPEDVTLKYSFIYFRSDLYNRLLCTFTKRMSETIFSKPQGQRSPQEKSDSIVSSAEETESEIKSKSKEAEPVFCSIDEKSEEIKPRRRNTGLNLRSIMQTNGRRCRKFKTKSESPIIRIRQPVLRHEKRNLSFFTRGRINEGKNRISLIKLNEHFVDFKLYRDIDLGVNRQKQKYLIGLVSDSHAERKRRLRLGRGVRKKDQEEVLRKAHRQTDKQKVKN